MLTNKKQQYSKKNVPSYVWFNQKLSKIDNFVRINFSVCTLLPNYIFLLKIV